MQQEISTFFMENAPWKYIKLDIFQPIPQDILGKISEMERFSNPTVRFAPVSFLCLAAYEIGTFLNDYNRPVEYYTVRAVFKLAMDPLDTFYTIFCRKVFFELARQTDQQDGNSNHCIDVLTNAASVFTFIRFFGRYSQELCIDLHLFYTLNFNIVKNSVEFILTRICGVCVGPQQSEYYRRLFCEQFNLRKVALNILSFVYGSVSYQNEPDTLVGKDTDITLIKDYLKAETWLGKAKCDEFQ
jgi:hypothetical protein